MIVRPEARRLYSIGWTLKKIGEKYGVSRQRVWQIIKRSYSTIDTSKRLKRKELKANPRPPAIHVFNKLKSLGYKRVNFMAYGSPFNIRLGKKKIEVRQRTKHELSDNTFRFNHLIIGKEKIDFYIFLCGDLNNGVVSYIVPSDIVKDSWAVVVNTKYNTKLNRKYRERWTILSRRA